MSGNFEIYESNMWQVYLFISIFSIITIFMNILFFRLLSYEDGWIAFLILNIPASFIPLFVLFISI